MSGMFFTPSNTRNRAVRLLIPYASFYVLSFIVYILKSALKREMIDWENFLIPLLGGTIGYQNTPLWFLLSLIEITIISSFLVRCCSQKAAIAISLVLAYLASLSKAYIPHVPYYIDVSVLCVPFFIGGYYCKDFVLQKLDWKLSIFAMTISLLSFILNPSFTNVSQNYLPQGFFLFFITAISASIGIIGISKYVRGIIRKVLIYLGRNSLSIMCVHMMLMMIDSKITAVFASYDMALANILSLILIMMITSVIAVIINRYISFIIGH